FTPVANVVSPTSEPLLVPTESFALPSPFHQWITVAPCAAAGDTASTTRARKSATRFIWRQRTRERSHNAHKNPLRRITNYESQIVCEPAQEPREFVLFPYKTIA